MNARYLLTGTVQSDKNHFHVTVQLIQSESGEQLWANTYERAGNVSELFNVQNEIVKQVVNQIAGNFGAISRNISRITSKNNIEDLNIYNAVFWYYHFINKNTEEIFHQAVAALRDAVKKDQEYALGWAILGDIYMGGHFLGFKDVNVNNLISEAIHCGRKSITVDPLCQQAYQTLALAFLFLHSKLECLTIIESWAKLKQGEAGISGGIGFCLICCGEYERGFKMISDSVELNPYYQWWLNGGASFYYYHKKDYDNCIHWAKKMNMADIPWELLLITASYAELGYSEEAKKMAFQIKKDFPFLQNILIDFVSAFLQDDALVQHILKGLKKAGLKEGSVN